MITIAARRKEERGQAVVESALVLLIFIPVLIGILDFGQFLYFHQSLTERARAGARYGAVHTFGNGSEAVNVAIYNNPAGAASGATALLPCITASCRANDGSGVQATVTATLSNPATDDSRIRVTIANYPFNFLTPFLSKSTWLRTVTATQPYEVDH